MDLTVSADCSRPLRNGNNSLLLEVAPSPFLKHRVFSIRIEVSSTWTPCNPPDHGTAEHRQKVKREKSPPACSCGDKSGAVSACSCAKRKKKDLSPYLLQTEYQAALPEVPLDPFHINRRINNPYKGQLKNCCREGGGRDESREKTNNVLCPSPFFS